MMLMMVVVVMVMMVMVMMPLKSCPSVQPGGCRVFQLLRQHSTWSLQDGVTLEGETKSASSLSSLLSSPSTLFGFFFIILLRVRSRKSSVYDPSRLFDVFWVGFFFFFCLPHYCRHYFRKWYDHIPRVS